MKHENVYKLGIMALTCQEKKHVIEENVFPEPSILFSFPVELLLAGYSVFLLWRKLTKHT